MNRSSKTTFTSAKAFMVLPDAEKERIWESFNREIPLSETKPLTAKEKAEFEAAQRAGRARMARERRQRERLRSIQVELEPRLLKRADAYAADHGISRAELIARGIKLAIAP